MPVEGRPRWFPSRACWRYRFRGRQYYSKGLGPKDGPAARRWADAIRDQVEHEDQVAGRPTVARLADWFLVDGVARGLTKKTLAGYDEMLRWFCAYDPDGRGAIGGRRADQVGAAELRAMVRGWERSGKAAHSRARLVRVVRACFSWAADDRPDRVDEQGRALPRRLIARDDMAQVKAPKTPATALDRAAELDDVARLLKWARADVERPRPMGTKGRCISCMKARRPGPCRRDHSTTTRMLRDMLVLLRLATAAGCRPGELCAARWEDWNPKAWPDPVSGAWWGVLKVSHKTEGHTGRKREVPVPPALRRAIERIRGRAGRHPEFLFTHRRAKGSTGRGAASAEAGEPWTPNALARRLRSWRDAAVEAGVPIPEGFTAYWLRHGFYSRAAPVIGAEAAGMVGGTSGAVVRRVYLKGRMEDLTRATAAARRRPTQGASGSESTR
ncbi:site-specific integrase [Tautonia sp. JC769]|uniref:tyrosine-type recombinase/integrase n=1 Tax=Tautonia sp. JC769 TaxID=3232135 RepID=UPI003457D2B5